MRIGVIADPHLSLDRDEPAAWHNPYRLADAHERLLAAFAHPLVAGADAVVVLGDLAHFGDRRSIRFVVDAAATLDAPVVLLSGNHDVLVDGVRLQQVVEAAGSPTVGCPLRPWPEAVVRAFDDHGLALEVHEILHVARRPIQPFDVSSDVAIDAPNTPALVLTHFPVLSLEQRCREAKLLYSGHLDQLAPPPSPVPSRPDRPTIVLSGHQHLRAVTTEGSVLQLVHAALVEPPYEVAAVELGPAPDGTLAVAYECASVREPEDVRLPVLDPPAGRWTYAGGSWSCDRSQPPYDASSRTIGSAANG